MALPVYASPLERLWHRTYLVICTAIFIFLIAPILIVIPLSFNAEPYFTFTPKMLALDPEERIEEIARMLAGEKITDAARENAREMIAAA